MDYEIIAIAVLGVGLGLACFLLWKQGRKIQKVNEDCKLLWDAVLRYGNKIIAVEKSFADDIADVRYKLGVLENHDNEHLEARASVDNEIDTLYGKLNLMDERMGALEEEFESRVAQHMEDESEAMRKQARTFDSLQSLLDYSMDTAMKGKHE